MLITLPRRAVICQSVAEVKLTGVAFMSGNFHIQVILIIHIYVTHQIMKSRMLSRSVKFSLHNTLVRAVLDNVLTLTN